MSSLVTHVQSSARGLAALRRFVTPAPRPNPVERCELCSLAIAEQHDHLFDPADRSLRCACTACAILFDTDVETKLRRVPRDIWHLPGFSLTAAHWSNLAIPIGLAFLTRVSGAERVLGSYPSPAGPAEVELDFEAWRSLAAANPVLQRLRPDVEALLVNRTNGARDYYIAPIDRCYALAGLIRQHWRGFSGGDAAWTAIHEFFTELHRQSRPASERHDA